MRACSWNLAHQTRRKRTPRSIIDAVAATEAELVVFTEFVEFDGRSEFHAWLDEAGYHHRLISPAAAKNRVLIASKVPAHPGDISGPDTTGPAIAGWLHVVLPDQDVELIGYRMPSYRKNSPEKADYLAQLARILSNVRDRSITIAGDFNIDPFENHPTATIGAFPGADGWTVTNPSGDWSWHSGRSSARLDFVAGTAGVDVTGATYVYEVGGIVLADAQCAGLSDHAALVFDVTHSNQAR